MGERLVKARRFRGSRRADDSVFIDPGLMLGIAAMTFTSSVGALTGTGALAGASNLTFASSVGALTGKGALAGASNLTFASSVGALTGTGALAGASNLTFASSAGVLQGIAAVTGVSNLTFASSAGVLTGTSGGAITGTSGLVFGGTGTLVDVGAARARSNKSSRFRLGLPTPTTHKVQQKEILRTTKEILEIAQRQRGDHMKSFVRLEELTTLGLADPNGNLLPLSPAVITGTTDHGALTGLADDDHPQYTQWTQNETVSGKWIFASASVAGANGWSVNLNSTNPGLMFYETDGAVDEKTWDIRLNAGVLSIGAWSDAFVSGGAALQIRRTGSLPTSVRLPLNNLKLEIGSAPSLTLAADGTNSIITSGTGMLLFKLNALNRALFYSTAGLETQTLGSAGNPETFVERGMTVIRSTQSFVNGISWGGAVVSGAPTALPNASIIMEVRGNAFDGAAFSNRAGFIQQVSTEAWSGTNQGSEIVFRSVANAATALTRRFSMHTNFRAELDNSEIQLGAGAGGVGDLRLFHDGTDSIIQNDAGILRFRLNSAAQNALFYNAAINTAGLTAVNESPNVIAERSSKTIRDNTGGSGPNFVGIGWGGPLTSAPAAQTAGLPLAAFRGGGYDGAAFKLNSGIMEMRATETWGATARGTQIVFSTTINAATNPVDRFSMQDHFHVLLDNSEIQIGAGQDLRLYHDGTNSKINNVTGRLDITSAGTVTVDKPFRLKGYTVATLPAGTVGDTAYVTDSLAPAFGVAVAGGGAVTIKVFYDGAAWIVG